MTLTGYDTAALSFKIAGPDTAPGALVNAVVSERGLEAALSDAKTLRRLPGGGTLRTGVGGYGVVEISSKYGDEGAFEPAGWDRTVHSLRSAYAEAAGYVAPLDTFEHGRIVRLDVVRDFDGGECWPQLATALVGAVGYPRARSRLFRDRDRGNSLSLTVGNSAWRAGVYDKHAESVGHAPAGRLRYEYRQGRRWSEKVGATWKGPGDSDARAKVIFAECRFGARVTGMQDVLTRLLADSGLSSSEQLRMLGWLYAESAGVVVHQSSRTAAKYRAIARRLGLVVGEIADGPVVSLDYDRGRVVTSLAA